MCNGITKLLSSEWLLFIDSSKRSLISILLHNADKLGSLPIAPLTKVKVVLDEIKYVEYSGLICMC